MYFSYLNPIYNFKEKYYKALSKIKNFSSEFRDNKIRRDVRQKQNTSTNWVGNMRRCDLTFDTQMINIHEKLICINSWITACSYLLFSNHFFHLLQVADGNCLEAEHPLQKREPITKLGDDLIEIGPWGCCLHYSCRIRNRGAVDFRPRRPGRLRYNYRENQ